jgi:uncharacterized linocin/CFP29 family protein
MDDPNAQVGWTEAQWNRVREEVLTAWQRVRVAGSFLPVYGPLPPSTQVVPSEVIKDDGRVDDRATAALLEIALPVTLSRQQIREENLSSAMLQFRRRATQLGQLEDWFIFNGTYHSIKLPPAAQKQLKEEAETDGLPYYRPDVSYLNALAPSQWAPMSGTPTPITGVEQNLQIEGMRQRNPGALGLIEGPRAKREEELAKEAEPFEQEAERARQEAERARQQGQQDQQAEERARQAEEHAKEQAQHVRDKNPLNSDGLMQAIVQAINSLEEEGYVAPYVCIFGRNPFEAAFISINNSTVLPRDRIEPLIGRGLLHASAIDVVPHMFGLYDPKPDEGEWRSRGVLLSMADEPIDLALAAEAQPEFRQVNLAGRYVFSVFERFALRIKDTKAIVPLRFEKPKKPSGATPPATS